MNVLKTIWTYKAIWIVVLLIIASVWAKVDSDKAHRIYLHKNGYVQGKLYDNEGNQIKEWRNGKLVDYKNPWLRLFTWDWE